MSRSFNELRDQIDIDPARRRRVEAHKRAIRAALEIAGLREARGVTQDEVASRLQVSQANISRIEHEQDVYVSTLARYVEALGGRLEISAVFPEGSIALLDAEIER